MTSHDHEDASLGEDPFCNLTEISEVEADSDENKLPDDVLAAKLYLSRHKIDRVESVLDIKSGFFKTDKMK